MRLGTIAFLCGILAVQYLDELPAIEWCWLLVLFPLLAFIPVPRLKLLVWLPAGFLWAVWHGHLLLASQLPAVYEGADLLLEGQVASLPKSGERRVRFDFRTRIEGRAYLLRLNWYQPIEILPATGETWRLRVKLKRPHGFMNPGSYDYERQLFRHGIGATGYVRSSDGNERLAMNEAWSLQQARYTLSKSIAAVVGEHAHHGLVEALAIGNRNFIQPGEWDILTTTGTSHLVAISGLHVGLVAGFAFLLGGFVMRRYASLITTMPAQLPAALVAIVVATVYAALAGFSVPTQRALVMVVVVMLAIMLRRELRSSFVLSLALLGVLLFDPLCVLDAGFWLSFTAVAIIVFCLQGRLKQPSRTSAWWRIQFVIALGMLPLVLVFFQRVSLVAPVANLLAVPWVSIVTVPLTLLGTICLDVFPWLAELLLKLSATSLDVLWWWLTLLAGNKFAVYDAIAPAAWTLVPAALGVAWLLMPRGVPARWLAAVLLVPLFVVTRPGPGHAQAEVTLLDVGQGLSVVVRTHRHVLVYDAGPRFSTTFDTGQAVVVPFLRHAGLRQLDMLMVSHGDADHSGGADSILEQFRVGQLVSGARRERWHHAGADACRAGQSWQWDGVEFEVLHPRRHDLPRGNNRSCVLQVRTGDSSLLIPGDIERRVELELVEQYSERLQSDVLVAPHHGSRTSSSAAFLAATSPSLVLVANGYRNRYGFPAATVTRRYDALGARWLETAAEGAISVIMTPDGVMPPGSWREQVARYWHTR